MNISCFLNFFLFLLHGMFHNYIFAAEINLSIQMDDGPASILFKTLI